MKSLKFFVTLIVLLSFTSLFGKVKLPAVISDNMVLQQLSIVRLWGEATPNTNIKVFLSWDKKTVNVFSDNDGKWLIEVNTPVAGGPYYIIFDDGAQTVIENILVGEVWLCSGQSNMEMPVKGFFGQPVYMSTPIIANATPETPIRMFSVKKEYSKTLKDDVIGVWSENDSKSVQDFSATAYYFGLQLYKSLRIPIGLIHTSWGGAKIEAWMPEELVRLFPELSLAHLTNENKIDKPQHAPCLLYNSMLFPLKNFSIKGVVWYQGESNISNSEIYEQQMVMFVDNLRKIFRNVNLPFYYTQIAPFKYSNSNGIESAVLREVQSNCESLISKSGMAVLMDVGDEICIHPYRKDVVGKRLAYLALNKTYNKCIPSCPPKYKSKKIDGDKIVINFDNIGQGLTSFGRKLNNFEIAGDDKLFVKANAVIHGDKVCVWSDEVKKPVAVRYAFKNYVEGDLFGVNGLPVSSFRTDF